MHGQENIELHYHLFTALGQNTLVGDNDFFYVPGKIKVDLYRSDIAETKYGNPNTVSPTTFKGLRFKIKSTFLVKKLIYFKISVHSSKRENCIYVQCPT